MISLKRYASSDKAEWDDFVRQSKNGTFLFLRDYMDYHSDRFHDHSLIYNNAKGHIIAMMPANETDGTLWSHQGLTYGGLILSDDTRAEQVLEIIEMTKGYLREQGFTDWYYKQIPTIYHRCPAQEDEYALWWNGATLSTCLISTTIPLNGCSMYPETERRRRRGVAKAENQGYQVIESNTPEIFWPIMERNLMDRYSIKPVHTLDEMQLLMSRFPELIRCFLVIKDGKAEAGAIVYLCNQECVHIQYGHATPTGKAEGALDMLYTTLREKYRKIGYHCMDFGNSNEQGGRYLNENLIAQKEGFGGRGVTYKTWHINVKE